VAFVFCRLLDCQHLCHPLLRYKDQRMAQADKLIDWPQDGFACQKANSLCPVSALSFDKKLFCYARKWHYSACYVFSLATYPKIRLSSG
jgi:hypothetical protein